MLPAAMRLAEVDKSDRLLLARVESVTGPQALAVLRDARGHAMSSAILVHPRFDLVWPLAADHARA